MSNYQNLMAYQSGLRNAGSEQRQLPQQDRGNRSLANMPIYPVEDEPTPLLSSFKSTVSGKPRNFSSDLLLQALAAKSNLGLCDGVTRSDALQSLRSYGSQSLQNSPSKQSQSVAPRYQDSRVDQTVQANPRHQDSHILQSVSPNLRSQESHIGQSGPPGHQNMGQPVPEYLHPALFSQSEVRQEEWYNRGMQEQSVVNDQLYQKNIGDSNESFTPFRPPPQLNTVEDEDEFLYGDATPMNETPGEAPRKEEVAAGKEGTGSWSDEEIMIVEDLCPGKLHYETPRPKPDKEGASIVLKDLSWKSTTAWKDEPAYSQKAEKLKAASSSKAKYRSSNRSESCDTDIATTAIEKSSSTQSYGKLTSQEKKAKYANAALLLKKQLDVSNLVNSDSPSDEMKEQMADQDILKKGLKSASADSSKGSLYQHLLINVEQGSKVSKKRVVSLTENSSPSKNINVSPLTVQHDKDIISKLETSTRVVRDTYESTRDQESPKIRPSHYLEDYSKSINDKLYERKHTNRDHSPKSPRRISPGSYRYRSPSVERRRRDRSPSPEYRSRHRSRPRFSEERGSEKSPRFRHRSRGRSPSYHSGDRSRREKSCDRRDKSCDRRISSKRQHSPDDSPRHVGKLLALTATSKKEALERPKPVPPSVEETLSAEPAEGSRLFPKSMSADMVALFMKKSEPPKEAVVQSKMVEPHPDPIMDSADAEIVALKLNFALLQVQQSELLNELIAQKKVEEENEKVSILAQRVELALDANTRRFETQSATIYPPTNPFPQPPYPMYPQSAPMPQPPPFQMYPYGYPGGTPAPFTTSYPYSQAPPSAYSPGQSPAYSQGPPPVSPASKLANAAPPAPSRWLRSVPVLSAEEMSKSKEAEQELVSQYLKLVEERNLSHKKLSNLADQVAELKKMKSEFENRSRKVRSGTDGQFIAEFQALSEKAAQAQKRESQELKRLNDEVHDLERKIKPSSLTKYKDNMKEEKKSSVVYGCFDTGKHFCLPCSMTFSSIVEMVKHLHTPKHTPHDDVCKDVATKVPPKEEAKATTLQPVKGVEFVIPVNAFYCSLCKELLLNPFFAEQHLKGHDHTVKYLNYLQENPFYEEERRLVVDARASTMLKENRLKELEDIKKAQKLILKKKQESAERLEKMQSRLQGEQLREEEVQELDEMETARKPLLRKAAIKVNLAEKAKASLAEKEKACEPTPKKPKQQVIYIGRAPNFKPKEKVLKEGEETLKKKLAKNQEVKWAEKCESALSKTASLPDKNRKGVESLGSGDRQSHWDRGRSSEEHVPVDKKKMGGFAKVKVFGCQSEAEAKSVVQGDRKHGTESKMSQKKEPKTVQLQMNEPKTDDPAVKQALKNILYGTKSKTPRQDSDLSEIKLPEEPPPPDEVTMKPKPIEKKCLTEEEKDFILLGINKSDMEPIAIPRPPPSSLLVPASSPTNTTKTRISPSNETIPASSKVASSNVTVPTSPLIALPNVKVPPPNLQVPPPNLQVPHLNLQVPPPNLQVLPPTLQLPPPILPIHMPHLQVPPPNILLNNSPAMHGPYGQAYNANTHFHGANYPQPQFNCTEVVDMDIDLEDGAGSEILVGTPRSNTAFNVPYPIKNRSGCSSKPTKVSPNESKPKLEVLQTSNPGHDDSKSFLNKKNACDSELKIMTDSGVDLKGDRRICANVLNSIIKTVLEKHSENSSADLSTRSSTCISTANEPDIILNFSDLKCPKVVSSELDRTSSSVFTDSTLCHKVQVYVDNANQMVDTAESEGIASSLNATNIKTSDFPPKVIDSQFTSKVSIDISELNSDCISENINTEALETKNHQELEPPKAKNPTCNPQDSGVISNQEDLSLPTQHFDVQKAEHEISNIKKASEVHTSQLDINKKGSSVLESKKTEPLHFETKYNELLTEKDIPSGIVSQENKLILQEKSLSSVEVPKPFDDIASLESKSEQINVMNYEDISEAPLIHGIEHFMDLKVDNQPHENSISAEEFPTLSFKQETVMPLKDENADDLSISMAQENFPKSPTELVEGSSMEFCVSGFEKMDVEENDTPVSTEKDSTQMNLLETQITKVEEIDVEENMLVADESLRIPQNMNYENNSLDSCISGIRDCDEVHQNPPSGLGLDCPEESVINKNVIVGDIKLSSKTPEDNLEVIGPLDAYNSKSGTNLEDHLKRVQCPVDIESSLNECKNENMVGKESTIKLLSCEMSPLDDKCSAQKLHSTEIEILDERTVHHHVHTENVEKKISIIDTSEDLQQDENQTTENRAKSDHLSESVSSLGIEVFEHAFQDMKTTNELLIEDIETKGNSEINLSVPCLEKYDLEDSLSNSLSDNPPVLSEEPIPENEDKLTKEKKQDSDTDEYENEDEKE